MCARCHDVRVGEEPPYAVDYVINVRMETPVGSGATQHCAHGRHYRNISFVEVIMLDPSAPTYRIAAHDRSSIHIVGGAAKQSAAEKITNSNVRQLCD